MKFCEEMIGIPQHQEDFFLLFWFFSVSVLFSKKLTLPLNVAKGTCSACRGTLGTNFHLK